MASAYRRAALPPRAISAPLRPSAARALGRRARLAQEFLHEASLTGTVHGFADDLAGRLERQVGDLGAQVRHRPLLLGLDLVGGTLPQSLQLFARGGNVGIARFLRDL